MYAHQTSDMGSFDERVVFGSLAPHKRAGTPMYSKGDFNLA